MVPVERDETLAMVWPAGDVPPVHAVPLGLQRRVDQTAFTRVQSTIGFEVSDLEWNRLTNSLVPGAMVFACGEDGAPHAVAAAQWKDDWIELGWVAVSPSQRGRGLGKAVCIELTRGLLSAGHRRLYGSTQDDRLAALRIYFALGFHPVWRKSKEARWRSVCTKLSVPFRPERWRGWDKRKTPRSE